MFLVDWGYLNLNWFIPQYSLGGPDPFAPEVNIFLFLKYINLLSSMREDR